MDTDSGSTGSWDYLDFELEIRGGGPREYPVAIRSPAGEARAEMRFPFDEWELRDRLQSLEIALLRSGGTRRRIPSPEEHTVQDFGRSLFESLLVGDVRTRYEMSLSEARRQGKGLRLKLRVQPSELAVLPWEFLYDAERDRYPSLSSNTPLVRYLDLPQPVEPLRVSPPLRILGMVTSPLGLDQLDVEHEKRLVEEATRGLRERGLLELTWLEGQTWRNLQHAMRRGPWHIFHFVGHGGFDPATEEGALALSDEAGHLHLLQARSLAELLDDHYPLRLVFLNSCEGARGSENDAFSSTAATLVRRGVPAVVAMQYEITDRAAIEFSRDFYEALADNLPVDAAVTEARAAVSMDSMLEWGTPVLYMHSPDGRVFDLLASAPRPHPPPETEDRQAEAGADAEPGSSVDVTVSSGPSTQADPDLAGQRPESSVQVPPVQTPPPASTPTRDQNGGQPRRRVPVWTMAVGAIFVLALIGGIVVLINRGQQGGGAEGAVQELTVAVNYDPLRPDSQENMQYLVKKFNEKYKGQYKVKPQEISSLDQLKTQFKRGSDGIDVVGGDVTWPAEFAENGWILDLSDRFPVSEQQKYLDATIQANTYKGKIWGVPWYTDAGMLYYRKDLLKKSGFSSPPKIWNDINVDQDIKGSLRADDLISLAEQVKETQGTLYGFVFQGANYEGGVVNGLEYIYSYGGQVLDPTDPSKVTIGTGQNESVYGLDGEGSMLGSGVAPQDVIYYKESQAAEQFLSGNAVFCRNWSYMYDLAGTEDDYITKDQIGIAPLPRGDVESVSGLGGRNFFISANSDAKDAAWEFIKFATSTEQQNNGAIGAGLLPTRRELYADQGLLDKVPVMDLGKEAILNAEPPPVSPYYSEMWPVMAKQFNAALKGEVTTTDAIETLQTKLTKIVEQNN